jgi:hypothetical protein
LVCQGHELQRIEAPGAEVQAISAAAALDRDAMGRELVTKPRDVRLQTVRRRRRRVLGPNLVEEATLRHDATGTQEERAENGTLLPSTERQSAAIDLGVETAQDAKAKWLGLVRNTRS